MKDVVEMKNVVYRDSLKAKTITELTAMLDDEMVYSAKSIMRLADLVAELDAKGEDVARIPRYQCLPLAALRKIAAGQFDAKAAERFQFNRRMFDRLPSLPLQDQQKLANDSIVKVIVLRDGGTDHRMLDIADPEFPRSLMSQVVGPGYLRTEVQQIEWLEAHRRPSARASVGIEYVMQGRTKGIRVNSPVFLSKAELRRILDRM